MCVCVCVTFNQHQENERVLFRLFLFEQGMQDFVKEPVLGLLKSVEDLAPEELMHGIARGAGSLLNHSVGGVANSVSLITGGNVCLGFSCEPTIFCHYSLLFPWFKV